MTQVSSTSVSAKLAKLALEFSPYFQIAWRHRYSIFGWTVLIQCLSLIYLFLVAEPYYRATITILPVYSSSSGIERLGGLFNLTGVNVAEGGSVKIYESILLSETVLGRVIYHKYQTEKYDSLVNLLEFFEVGADESFGEAERERLRFLSVFRMMQKSRLQIELDKVEGMMTVRVEMPESKLAADVANELAASLDWYVQTQRKSNAAERRKYLELRQAEIQDSLRNYEDLLKNFRERNVIISQSPQLLLEESRLLRAAEMYHRVNVELFQQLELARIDEVKDAPIINLKEEAREPVLKSGPRRAIIFLMVSFVAFMSIAVFYATKHLIAREMRGIYAVLSSGVDP